ncbi:MAG: Flagellar hook protein FlgE [Gammaproteobacteria bacterium]|nr:Flagellar hook protein FlgE [Gammaproteobacteria bacterium]
MPFRTAISGLRASMTDLSTIGNNVANASTTGFKKSRAEFADVYAASNVGVAGDTPGSGVNVARVAQQFAQGTVSFTESALDLAINGNGFFIVNDGGANLYTRAGAFGVDRQGYIVNAQNQRLQAFQADATGNITGATGDLLINTSNVSPSATTGITIGLNLDSSASVPSVGTFDPTDTASYNNATSTTVYDSLGNSHIASMYYVKTGANAWNTYTYVDGTAVDGPTALTFDTSGALTAPAGGTFTTASFTPGGGGAAMTLDVSYGTSTQYGSPFSVNSMVQDGYTTGTLSGIDVDKTGVIFARYSNGQAVTLGQIALANFANQQGLQPVGDTNWAETYEAGAPLISSPGSSNLGLIQGGALEESNVDLSEELVKMIVAQRNFQANAQVIQTADQVTQSIINIR